MKSIVAVFIPLLLLLIIAMFIFRSSGNSTSGQKQELTTVAGMDTTSSPSTRLSNDLITIDSSTILKLKPDFRVKTDEFKHTKWYYPKSAPSYVNYNGLFCYFNYDDLKANNLRLQMQYNAEDWLFIRGCSFLIDGNTYDLELEDVKRDNGSGEIWEWADEPVIDQAANIVRALAKAKSAKVKYIGQQYYHITTITPKQLHTIKETVEMYQAMGGKL